ncbi:MAG: CapA family protein [Ruminococcus sp.]|nr:CapA family protein [Ruminococcus sp.]
MKSTIKARICAVCAVIAITLGSCGVPITDNDKIGSTEAPVNLSSSEDESKSDSEKDTDKDKDKEKEKDNDDEDDSEPDDDEESEDEDDPDEDDSKPKDTPTEGTATVHLVCAGDNLIHDNIYVDAQNDDGSYDFSKCYEPVRRLIEPADIAILNQETLVNDAFDPSTFPLFSTPTECGDAVVDLGFNVISMSNNHVLDKGAEGLISSLDYWDTKDVVHYGAYRDEDDADDIKTMEVNGVTFAFLGYMEHTNGIFLDDNGPGKVVYISEKSYIEDQVKRADKMADVVVVSCHFGTEIYNEINDMQVSFSNQLVEWGADLIIGTQAHALSTCTYLDKPDGGQAFVFYGLGNFFSTMYDADNEDGRYGKSLIGYLGDLDIVKDFSTGEITLENIKCIPVVSHYEGETWNSMWYNCRVYPWADYTDDMMKKHMMCWRSGVTKKTLENYIAYIPDEFLSIE